MEDDKQKQIQELWDAIKALQNNTPLTDHYHNGFDVSRINFSDIYQKKIWIEHTIYGTDAATAGNYKTIMIVPTPMTLTGFKEVHTVLGTDGSAVTLDLEKLTGTTAPGSGSSMLLSTVSLKSTINTVVTGSLTATLANRSVVAGDRIALKLAGTPTSVANVTVLIEFTLV